MRNKNNKHLGIEIDPELHYKLHYISKYFGRSANGEILYLIRQEIKAFEETEGEIVLPKIEETKYPTPHCGTGYYAFVCNMQKETK